jgi:hypothetical protein
MAIRSDECLDKLFPGTISRGGVRLPQKANH